MISFMKSIVIRVSDFFNQLALSLPSKKGKEENTDVEVSMGEMVTPPPHFHVDRNPSSKKKRGRPSKKSKRSK